jgi:myo-inositol 2-dehydrogenase/D-chiro-inositol 1-dehydrogenase
MPAYAAEWAAFVTAVNSGSALPVTLADGVAALAMAEAATLSVKTGHPVALASVLG